jgi:hypothetical protein
MKFYWKKYKKYLTLWHLFGGIYFVNRELNDLILCDELHKSRSPGKK